MFQWALGEGRVPDDPTLGVKRVKAKTIGYKTWSEAEIERFELKYPIGTRLDLHLVCCCTPVNVAVTSRKLVEGGA